MVLSVADLDSSPTCFNAHMCWRQLYAHRSSVSERTNLQTQTLPSGHA